ncbi:hypothetical protein FB451DRAFT_314671 [Mycena latifolia]|nr:hypothetical protein FB451DRAFT_314671 [Mycena latifolia]
MGRPSLQVGIVATGVARLIKQPIIEIRAVLHCISSRNSLIMSSERPSPESRLSNPHPDRWSARRRARAPVLLDESRCRDVSSLGSSMLQLSSLCDSTARPMEIADAKTQFIRAPSNIHDPVAHITILARGVYYKHFAAARPMPRWRGQVLNAGGYEGGWGSLSEESRVHKGYGEHQRHGCSLEEKVRPNHQQAICAYCGIDNASTIGTPDESNH